MSDLTLRELQRKWQQSGDKEDRLVFERELARTQPPRGLEENTLSLFQSLLSHDAVIRAASPSWDERRPDVTEIVSMARNAAQLAFVVRAELLTIDQGLEEVGDPIYTPESTAAERAAVRQAARAARADEILERTALNPDLVTRYEALGEVQAESRFPWDRVNEHDELPGGSCCQRATGSRCYDHDRTNYDLSDVVPEITEEEWDRMNGEERDLTFPVQTHDWSRLDTEPADSWLRVCSRCAVRVTLNSDAYGGACPERALGAGEQ